MPRMGAGGICLRLGDLHPHTPTGGDRKGKDRGPTHALSGKILGGRSKQTLCRAPQARPPSEGKPQGR